MEKCNNPDINEFVKSIFKPGAVLVSYGMRGGGKTHCAVSFCQRLIEGYYDSTPKHVVLITNVIFVMKTQDGNFATESPPGVHTIHSMKEIFPIVVKVLEKYGRKDTMVILMLDEAQNFLLGDMNNVGDMAASMKKFCGIIRKFNLCLWLLSPAMRNLGPAFRNFLDAENDPGNVNTTFQKNNVEAERYIKKRNLQMDPRSIVYVKVGANERPEMMIVPTSSWTRNPDNLAVGEYAYDNLSSADFIIGDFPFHEFVQHISGKSSYDMVGGIKEFYERMLISQDADPVMNRAKIESELKKKLAWRMRDLGYTQKKIAAVFGVTDTTIKNWTEGWTKPPEETEKKGENTENKESEGVCEKTTAST